MSHPSKLIEALKRRFRGVTWKRIRWAARIRCEGELHDLGLFDSEEDAALAYNRKAKELFGEFARLNEVRDLGQPIQRRPALY